MLVEIRIILLLAMVTGILGVPDPHVIEECKGRYSVTQERYTDFLIKRIYDEYDKDLKCLFKCLFFKTGVINNKGYFNADRFIDRMMVISGDLKFRLRYTFAKKFRACNDGAVHLESDDCDKSFKKILCFIS